MSLNNDPYGIRDLQLQGLKILEFLDEVCRKNGLTYYLAYGTLLGAIRHHGFIPWDDDIDVWMPRKDYIRLLEFLRKENTNKRFVLNEGKYKPDGDRPAELQIKILDTGTKISKNFAGRTIEFYPWIDIFALDSFPENKKNSYLKKFKRQLFMYKVARCKHFLIDEPSFFGKMNKIVYTLHQKFKLFFFLNEDKYIMKAAKEISKYKDIKTPEYFCYAAVYLPKPEKCFFTSEWFGEPVEVTFEGRSFYAPRCHHEILTRLYNNYMELPPEHQRTNTHGVTHADK